MTKRDGIDYNDDPRAHPIDNKLRKIGLFIGDQLEIDQKEVSTKATIKRIIVTPAFIALAPFISLAGATVEGYYEMKDRR